MTAAVAQGRGTGAAVALLRLAGAALLAAIAAIHLYLWQDGYDSIPTIGDAFVVQAVLGFGGAVLLLVSPARYLVWAALLGLLFALGSLGALLQSTYGLLWLEPGMFGFVESDAAPWWQETFWVEVAAIAVLLVLTVLAAARRRR
ncbi:hypothetical protein [Trujillonella humicola]|uniref:hypothetical protein n=1 Tax=Trujillonella humicola TaxID=3383699 RepID=UPI003906C5B1